MTELGVVVVVAVIGLVGLLALAAVKLHGRAGKGSDTARAEDWTRGNGNTPGTGGGVFGGL